MSKRKIIYIVGVALLLCLLVAVIIEASNANARDNLLGKWKNQGDVYEFCADGSVLAGGVKGEWSYSFFKATVEIEGESTVFKCKGDSLVSDSTTLVKDEALWSEPVIKVNFFKKGFMGYGEKGNFKYWSFAHFLPIILYGVAVYLIYHYRDKLKNWKHEENFRFIFAAVMLLAEMSYFWRLLYVGSGNTTDLTLLDKLPLQVCEWTCIFAIFMITKKSKWLYPICFYVCLTIGVFPLLTPSVITTTGPAYYRYYQYWLEHILPPLAVFYMTFVHGFRPTKRGIIPAACFMGVLTTFAIICNTNIEGANYLYIAKGTAAEGGGSLMDPIYNLVGGSLPLLLLLLGAVVISIFFAAYYIYVLICKLNAKKAESSKEEKIAVNA